MNKKRFNLKNFYSARIKYLKESKNYIFTISIIFFSFILIGYLFPTFFADKLLEIIKQLMEKFTGLGLGKTIGLIFFNNLQASLFSVLFGVAFGVLPLFSAIVNGYFIGFVANKVIAQEGIFVLWRLLPHGIFELPAVLISMGLGLRIGLELFKKKSDKNLKRNIVESIKSFLAIVLPLLLIAAIIEGTLVFFIH